MKRNALERVYDRYNKRWFGNRLPKKCRVFYTVSLPRGSSAAMEFDPPKIGISPELKGREAHMKMDLLHEMVHFDLGESVEDHPPEFDNRMRSLALRGAFDGLW